MASPSSQSASLSLSTAPSTPPEVGKTLSCFASKQRSSGNPYKRWRPSFHLQPRSGWLNDPCAPFYDAKTGLYHVSFQWNPNGPDWGDISWGTATSPDMIHWTVRDEPVLSPDTDYDGKGVFTGCFVQGRDGALVYVYTSVSALPIHYTLPHPSGCESLSLARSFDHGHTWQKATVNPVLPCEPEGLDVIGWRDPYVARWPEMARMLRLNEPSTLFGIISGGIRDVTPTTFLYSIDPDDLTRWHYIGPLVNFGRNFHPSRWSGDLGVNWEVTNFLTLKDEMDPSVTRSFLVMGAEGCVGEQTPPDCQALSRPSRSQLWMSGTLRQEQSTEMSAPSMSYDFGGHLDHGCLYAANSFFDPLTKKTLIWGWIPEDDLCDDLRHMQGWSGMLSMPRELRIQTLQHVVGVLSSSLEDISSIEVVRDQCGSKTVRTLASQPLETLVQSLRAGPGVRHSQMGRSKLSGQPRICGFSAEDMKTDRWEIRCSIRVSRGCRQLGLRIGHSEDYSQATTLSFDPSTETFSIERPAIPGRSIAESNETISSKPERAPHTLFITRDPASGVEEMENLEIAAWRDNSALEVFVNGRTAISTRLYAADETFGLRFFAGDEVGAAPTELVSAEVWDGIGLHGQ